MAISDLLGKLRDAKTEETALPGKFTHLPKAIQQWMNAWPNQETGTDILRASGVHGLCPREFVLNYWQPKANKSFDWSSLIKMSTGTHLHHVLQNHILGPMGVLHGTWRETDTGAEFEGFHPDPLKSVDEIMSGKPLTWMYVEPTVWDEHHRISGHKDGHVDLDRVKYIWDNAPLFKKDPKLLCKRLHDMPMGELFILEIKTTSKFAFDGLSESRDIADYYKMQACIYQKLSAIEKTLFWFMERDSMASKTFIYDYEEGWWRDAKRKAKIIWESIRDEVLPESMMACRTPADKRAKGCTHCEACFGKLSFKNYVERGKTMAAASGRKLLDLSGVTFE